MVQLCNACGLGSDIMFSDTDDIFGCGKMNTSGLRTPHYIPNRAPKS